MASFSNALISLKAGNRVGRAGWNGRGMCIRMAAGDERGSMLPFIVMRTARGDLVPWLASQTDILADDWELTS